MKRESAAQTKSVASNDARSSFGKWGWCMIIMCICAFWLSAGMQQEGLNISLSQFNMKYGWNRGLLLTCNGVGGYIGMLGTALIGVFAQKKGVKLAFVTSIAAGGLGMILWGSVQSIGMYIFACSLVNFMGNGFGYACCSMLLTHWFPTKKGLAMGWAAIGAPLATATYPAVYTGLSALGGMVFAHTVIGFAAISLGVAAFALMRNNPEEIGLAPDNDPHFDKTRLEAELKMAEAYKKTSQWTLARLLANTQIWRVGVGLGLLMMCNSGILAQFIPRCTELGLDERRAMLILSIAAVIGGLGCYLWGLIDQKAGVKRAAMAMALMSAGGIAFNLAAGLFSAIWALYVSVMLAIFCLGATANFIASLIGSIFGRFDFDRAFTPALTIGVALRTASLLVLGFLFTATGSFDAPYVFLLAAALTAAFLISGIKMDCIGRASLTAGESECDFNVGERSDHTNAAKQDSHLE